ISAWHGRVPVPAPAGLKPAEIRGRAQLLDKGSRLGIDDVNDYIGTIGEIVGLGRLVVPTNIKGVQGAGRVIRGTHGDRNGLEQPDGSLITLALICPRSRPDHQ